MTVTRFAPSPTWYVHIGSLRTVLYNYLFAKWKGWKFMLRIEDTDRNRLVDGSVENMIDVLLKTWVAPDEGPNNPWENGPYYQSERLEIYNEHIKTLLDNGSAYYCFCSSERLDELRAEQEAHNLPTKYDGKCRYLTPEEIKENLDNKVPYTIRLKVPVWEKVVFHDTIKWKIEIDTKDIDDQVLMKTDWFPTYHLANVVDDHLMGVTDVIRWEEWVPSTPKHILLYKAFGWEAPTFHHLPLILGFDGKKLSKRNWDVSVELYFEKGYLTEALMNHMAMLGWNPKSTKEIFSMEELIAEFKPENINKSGSVFDVEKLDWFNTKYMSAMSTQELYPKFISWASKYNPELLSKISEFTEDFNKKILNELKTKLTNFSKFEEETTFFYNPDFKVDEELFINPKMKIEDQETARKSLKLTKDILENISEIESIDQIKQIFIEKIKEAEMKNGQVLWPVRVALTWEKFSPWALEMIYILWKEESIKRLNKLLK